MQKYAIANWKMNLPAEGISAFFDALTNASGIAVGVAPPFPFVREVADRAAKRGVLTGAQNCSDLVSGAYTGEVSSEMLKSCGCGFVIVGHSERRRLYGETNAWIGRKIAAVWRAELLPVFCIGEEESVRITGGTNELLKRQISEAIEECGGVEGRPLVVAYEPVWAIGTGRNATPDIVEETHVAIDEMLRSAAGNALPILYGGSVTGDNATTLAAVPLVSGFLVGGASLKPAAFSAICAALSAATATR